MKNPLSLLPMFNQDVPNGTFGKGFVKGATSGALMMGIFSGVMGIASLTPLGVAFNLTYALTTIALGSLSTGLFSGIMATQRAAESARSASNLSVNVERREPVRAPEHALAPVVEQATTRSRQWTTSVGRSSSRDHISEILADRSLSDGDRAAAILKDREQASTLENAR